MNQCLLITFMKASIHVLHYGYTCVCNSNAVLVKGMMILYLSYCLTLIKGEWERQTLNIPFWLHSSHVWMYTPSHIGSHIPHIHHKLILTQIHIQYYFILIIIFSKDITIFFHNIHLKEYPCVNINNWINTTSGTTFKSLIVSSGIWETNKILWYAVTVDRINRKITKLHESEFIIMLK